jgi:hypothetical protein
MFCLLNKFGTNWRVFMELGMGIMPPEIDPRLHFQFPYRGHRISEERIIQHPKALWSNDIERICNCKFFLWVGGVELSFVGTYKSKATVEACRDFHWIAITNARLVTDCANCTEAVHKHVTCFVWMTFHMLTITRRISLKNSENFISYLKILRVLSMMYVYFLFYAQ